MGSVDSLAKCSTVEACVEVLGLPGSKADRIVAFENELSMQAFHAGVLERVKARPLTPEESEMLARVFQDIDKNKDGTVGREELRKFFVDHGNFIRKDDLEKLMGIGDKDCNGDLNLKEFKEIAQKVLECQHHENKLIR
mmetsp:Transcript_76117/g.131820  ORF Transcript_76117/g.131820 Transcript_76117/m.131820 type:complete len:139 (-) Transcript_76117:12-428(-)